MAHYHAHGGYARAAQRRGDEYAMCLTCGQRAHRFQAKPIEPIGMGEVREVVVGVVVLITLGVAFWLMFAIAVASQVTP